MKIKKIDLARQLIESGISEEAKITLEREFPELKESEDERAGNLIYCIVRDREDVRATLEANGVSVERALAYLKKQKDVEIEIEKAYKNADEIQYKKGFEDGVASVEPAEWSEEDEAFLKVAIAICNRYSHKDIADWLESLRPQPHWKPSEQ